MTRIIESARWLFVLAVVDAAIAQTNAPGTNATKAATTTAADSEAVSPSQPAKPGEFRATWIHSGYGIEGWGWDKTVGVLKSNGFSAMLPNLLWAGLAHYPSKILPISPKVKQQGDQIAECLKACRKYGIEMHVWKVNYNLLNAPPEFVARLRGAGRIQKNRQGNDVNWLCPSHPENVALERDSLLEVVREYDVDGIHFDYIRYPDKDACFCSGCRDRFEKAHAVKIARWPDAVLTGEYAAPFADWRREQITQLVRTVSQEAHAIKPGIKVSAAVWGGWVNARKSIGQDALAWIDAGYLDFVCPMDYEGADSTFTDLVRKQVAATNHKIPLYIGMGAHKLSGPPQLARQIQFTRDLGADGFVVFNLTEKLATEFLPPLRLGNPAVLPAPRP